MKVKRKNKTVLLRKKAVKKAVKPRRRVSVKRNVKIKAKRQKTTIKKPYRKANISKKGNVATIRRNIARKKPILKKLLKKRQHKTELARSSASFSESFSPNIKVIGMGGGGGSIVSQISNSLKKATFVIADTDIRAFKKKKGILKFIFGQELTRGLGTGLNVDLAKEAAEREKEKIAQLFKDQDIVIFVACLGGGLGSGATQVFLEAAKDFSGITLGIFTLPFKFEGKSKHTIATRALRELREALNVSITIPNERIFKVINEDTPITNAFSMVNKSLIESLESLINLVQSPGLINIDFADLRAILQGKGNLAFLNTAESAGKEKAEEVIKEVLHNPLYQDNFTPGKVLFNIEGGKNLSMFEVDKISKAISEKNPKAKIIFGISRNPKFKNKIKTILLMTGPVLGQANSEKELGAKPKKKSLPSKPRHKKTAKKPQGSRIPVFGNVIPVFNNEQSELIKKLDISEDLKDQKKHIRRSALEIKEAEVLENSKKSKQEEEWEIPAFLRFKK